MRKHFGLFLAACIVLPALATAVDGDNSAFAPVYTDPLTSLLAGTDGAQRVEYMTVVGDTDGDGADEIVCAPRLGGAFPQGARLEVYEATADDTYQQSWTFDGDSGTYWRSNAVAAGDLDGNGTREIIMGVNSNVTDVIAVFENTGADTWDDTPNLYTYENITGAAPPATLDFASLVYVGDLDGDTKEELLFCTTNTQDAIVIASVASGTFAAGDVVWSLEFERNWETADKGSPYGLAVGLIDADTNIDIAVVAWDNLRVDLYEASAADTYALASSANLSATDDYTWYAAKISDFDGDGTGELWITNIIDGNVYGAEIADVDAMTVADFTAVFNVTGAINMAVGDQDHGAGTDGGDLYFVGGMDNGTDNVIINYEYQSGDPLDAANYVMTEVVTGLDSPDDTLWMVEAPANDLDGDSYGEIVFTREDADGTRDSGTGEAAATSLMVLEWQEILSTNSDWNLFE